MKRLISSVLLLIATPVFAQQVSKVDNETIKVTREENVTAEQWHQERSVLVSQKLFHDEVSASLASKIADGDSQFTDNGIDFEKVVSDKKAAEELSIKAKP